MWRRPNSLICRMDVGAPFSTLNGSRVRVVLIQIVRTQMSVQLKLRQYVLSPPINSTIIQIYISGQMTQHQQLPTFLMSISLITASIVVVFLLVLYCLR
jgi:hypothetical protein